MKKCPYCFEEVLAGKPRCPHCQQFFLDEIMESEHKSLDKKRCIFCGKKIFTEARVCKYCHRWVDEIDAAADDLK